MKILKLKTIILIIILLTSCSPNNKKLINNAGTIVYNSSDNKPIELLSSNISEKTIAYRGTNHPGFTSIKFKTNKPVVANIIIGPSKIQLSKWLNKQTDFEINFVPMDYSKALYYEFEELPPRKYVVRLELIDDGYNKLLTNIGSIEVVKENIEKPLVEVLDINITNEVKTSNIPPKIRFKYRVNRPGYITAPIFYNYAKGDYVSGGREVTKIGELALKNYASTPGVSEVEWDLKPNWITYNGKTIVQPGKYKIFFRSQEESIKKYRTQDPPPLNYSDLNDDENIDFLISSNKNNTEITMVGGWSINREPNTVFKDIQNHWSKDSILFLKAYNIVKGTGNNKFNPNGNITRAEYINMILNALNINIEDKNKSKFIDVEPYKWYYDTVQTSVDLGLTTGYEDNTFRPNNPITRQEMTVIAEKALSIKKNNLLQSDENILYELNVYIDKNNISPWAKNSVAIAKKYNLIKGKTSNTFDPNGISTRAEGATIIKRLYDFINSN